MPHVRPTSKTLFSFLLITALVSLSWAQETSNSHDRGNFYLVEKNYPGAIDGYNLYVPKKENIDREGYPVIVFLQGGLGVGGEVEKILNWALPKLLADNGTSNSELNELLLDTFVVIMPHIEQGQFYQNEEAMRMILKEVETEFSIDMNRIYLTGLSRGGHGSWGLACRMNDVFAAVAPICGGSHGIDNYNRLATLPIWVTHNTGDRTVSYTRSRDIVRRLNGYKNISFQRTATLEEADYKSEDHIFTSTVSDSHDAWTDFYTHADVYRWFLKYKKE